jgi:type I restriction-modification system DNA methylase subunit/restriction endonuclease S subunit
MITQENFKSVLLSLDFEENKSIFSKSFPHTEGIIKVDFNKKELIYPEDHGLIINERQTCNFSQYENFVVFECVHRLLSKGYKPEHIELEPKWKVGHGASGGRADILVKSQQSKPMLIIECKTAGKEFDNAWKDTKNDGGQLISYAQQIIETEFLCLYTSDFLDNICIFEYYVISHKDNPKILAEDDKLLSFDKAKDVKERFKVWKETYQLEATTKGIFEDNIPAYQIGKDKYTIEDLKFIDAKDKDKKYHIFRTILRKYNVSGRENAFDILVNLFLCKIVDETQHPQELKFYWKGIAYDNYYDFIDRLQGLYKYGMEKYLGEDITYVSNDDIENAFWPANRNAIKTTIKDYFRQLKFFTNNDFAFIDVYNKNLFNKNIKILLEIVQMWQDLRLKNQEQNQFLGDMFEFFLDNGIKQSEGQFFTPIPITRFICMSLPLENIIKDNSELPRVIDFACGSGHFLTELAIETKPFIEKYKKLEPSAFFRNIYGIEKESRLSKVAKVSAFMYGQEGINILPHDALDDIPEIKLESFDILVANPPFAVEDFLDTLSEEQRQKYELFGTISDLGNKNIQCFFIERAKQLLAPNGVAGIIVPSSVLSNSDNTHIATREILLKYFDIISLVELGSNTFSKTGTNTVILFLRRKSQRPEPAEQYKNRVLDFFENWQDEIEASGGIYGDIYLVKKYCEHINVGFDDYQTLLLGVPSEQLLEYELFKEYKNEFDKSTDIVNLKKRKSFKDLSSLEKEVELNKRFLEYLQIIEKDKLYYFILAFNNSQKVLIVKSPGDNKEQKQFLGYEWSNAKGNEGLKYLAGSHITPLFDPDNRYNSEKINYWIQQNFHGNSEDVELQNLSEYITYASLVDLLDFSRKDFNKTFSLTPKKNLKIETKWELVKLENICEIVRGASPRPIDKYITTDINGINWIKIGDVSQESKYITQTAEKITLEGAEKSRKVNEGDFILSNSMSFGRPYIMKISGCIHDGWLLLSKFSEKLNKDYLYEILSYKDTQQQFSESAAGGVVQNLNTERVRATKIPLAPLEVQQQIVDECQEIDQNVIKAKEAIEQAKNEIENKSDNIYGKYNLAKLGSICDKPQYGANESAIDGNPLTDYRYIRITDINDNGELNSEWRTAANIEEKYILKEGDFLFARSGATVGKTFLYKNKYGKALYAGYLIRFRTNKDKLLPDFLKLVTQSSFYKKWVADTQTGTSQPNINGQMYSDLQIPLPPLSIQEKLVSEVEKLEQVITNNQKIVDESSTLKQQVMKKYL